MDYYYYDRVYFYSGLEASPQARRNAIRFRLQRTKVDFSLTLYSYIISTTHVLEIPKCHHLYVNFPISDSVTPSISLCDTSLNICKTLPNKNPAHWVARTTHLADIRGVESREFAGQLIIQCKCMYGHYRHLLTLTSTCIYMSNPGGSRTSTADWGYEELNQSYKTKSAEQDI